ncbi:hypothetical protein D9M73_233580 [compost metagenome]
MHRIVGFKIGNAVGVAADVQVVGQAIAVVQAQHVGVPAGSETELRALDPFVAGGSHAAAVVLLPVELAVTQCGEAVIDKTIGSGTPGQ